MHHNKSPIFQTKTQKYIDRQSMKIHLHNQWSIGISKGRIFWKHICYQISRGSISHNIYHCLRLGFKKHTFHSCIGSLKNMENSSCKLAGHTFSAHIGYQHHIYSIHHNRHQLHLKKPSNEIKIITVMLLKLSKFFWRSFSNLYVINIYISWQFLII